MGLHLARLASSTFFGELHLTLPVVPEIPEMKRRIDVGIEAVWKTNSWCFGAESWANYGCLGEATISLALGHGPYI
jgi:hypothetical protein